MVCVVRPLLSFIHHTWSEGGCWSIPYAEKPPWERLKFSLEMCFVPGCVFSTSWEVDRRVYFCDTSWAISAPPLCRCPGGIVPRFLERKMKNKWRKQEQVTDCYFSFMEVLRKHNKTGTKRMEKCCFVADDQDDLKLIIFKFFSDMQQK